MLEKVNGILEIQKERYLMISNDFKEAVENKKIRLIKIMLKIV